MRTLISVALVTLLTVGIALAGEYQRESAAFEAAFAAKDYGKAAGIATTNVGKGNALNAQAYKLLVSGDMDGAKKLLLESIAADPEQFWAHNNLGVILLAEGDCSAAMKEFQLSVDANSKASDERAGARVDKAKANIAIAEKDCM